MKTIDEISLTKNQQIAINKVKDMVTRNFNVDKMYLFGSAARNNSDDESDTDLLILTKEKLSREVRHGITDIVFEINLANDTNLSTTVIDIDSWENGVYTVLPIHKEIDRDGILI